MLCCVLTGVYGGLRGGGESVKVYVDRQTGYWYLRVKSARRVWLKAAATAIIFPKEGEH